MELDSHADTCIFGKNFVVMHKTGRECDVSAYSDTLDTLKSVPVVCGATAWTHPDTSEVFILVFHEGLDMRDIMSDSLLNPNQLHHFGTRVQDNAYDGVPLFMESVDGEVVMPMWSDGNVIFVDARTPVSYTHLTLPTTPYV